MSMRRRNWRSCATPPDGSSLEEGNKENWRKALVNADPRIAIVDAVFDVEESELPFGKRWRQEKTILTAEHLAALREGRMPALDVQDEYVVFAKRDAAITANLKELGYGG